MKDTLSRYCMNCVPFTGRIASHRPEASPSCFRFLFLPRRLQVVRIPEVLTDQCAGKGRQMSRQNSGSLSGWFKLSWCPTLYESMGATR